jgi:hypothetical protein
MDDAEYDKNVRRTQHADFLTLKDLEEIEEHVTRAKRWRDVFCDQYKNKRPCR